MDKVPQNCLQWKNTKLSEWHKVWNDKKNTFDQPFNNKENNNKIESISYQSFFSFASLTITRKNILNAKYRTLVTYNRSCPIMETQADSGFLMWPDRKLHSMAFSREEKRAGRPRTSDSIIVRESSAVPTCTQEAKKNKYPIKYP